MAFAFDHIVIGASDLDAAAEWAVGAFGRAPAVGGSHPEMGTTNRLARMAEGYLELIAIDPAAPAPARKRWYGLDSDATQDRLRERPRTLAWVLAVDDLEAAIAAAPWDAGRPVRASRGDLSWRIALRDDGAVADGVLPVFIEWPDSLGRRAPLNRMVDLGRDLRELRLSAPDAAAIDAQLAALGVEDALRAQGIALRVRAAPEPSIEGVFTPRSVALTL